MDPDDPTQDNDEEFDYEKLRQRRLEELGPGLPQPAPEPPAPAAPKQPAKARPKPKAKPRAKPAARRRSSSPSPPSSAAPSPEPPARGFPELSSLDPDPLPTSLQEVLPSRVHRSLLPTGGLPGPPGRPPPTPDPPPGTLPSSILITLGAICIAVFVVLQILHGSTASTTASVPSPSPPTAPGPVTGTTTSPGTANTPTPPARPKFRWSNVVTLRLNSPVTFASHPPTPTESFGHGLEVDRSGSTTELVADGQGDSVSPWQGSRAPTAAECAASAGSDRVQLGGSGVPRHGWICALSGPDDLRLRYLSGSSGLVSSAYRFLVTVWSRPGASG